MVGIRSPDGLLVGSCTSHPGVLGSIPNEEPGKTGAPCVQVPGSSRVPLVFDVSIAHDRFGSSSHVQQNGLLTHTQDLDGPLRVAAQRKINAYGQQYADNQNIYFFPAVMSTSCRMHGEFLRLLFLQAHRETEAAGISSQNYQTDAFRFKRAAFLQSLKSKIGLAASKTAALRINLNIQTASRVVA